MPRPRPSRLAGAILVVATLSASGESRADSCSRIAGGCVDDDPLWARAGAAMFMGIGGAVPVASGAVAVGLSTSYLHRPVVGTIAGAGAATAVPLADHQWDGTLLGAFGVTRRLELDLALPFTLGETGSGMDAVTGSGRPVTSPALRNVRFGFMYALLESGATGSLDTHGHGLHAHVAARFEMAIPTAVWGTLAGESVAVWAPSITADVEASRFFVGAEIGARIRPTGELLGARVGSQLLFAAGFGVHVLPPARLDVLAEARELPTLTSQGDVVVAKGGGLATTPSSRPLSPGEWMVSVRSAPSSQMPLALQLGFGSALGSDVTSPDVRVALSLRYAPRGPR